MKKRLNFIYIYSIFTLTIFFLPNEAISQNTYNYDSLNLHISKYMEVNRVPGFAICAVNDDSIIWSNAYGKANIESGLDMNIDATMMIASISKTITSTAVMQLWENGLINIEYDINEYLPLKIRNPYFPDIPITIKQLLTHTSSINDGTAYDESYHCGDPAISLKYWIKNYFIVGGEFYNATENFNNWQPGEKLEYSNVGFGLLGYLVEEITGISFNEYCRRNIFDPLNMKNTGWYYHEVDSLNQITNYILIDRDNLSDTDLINLSMRTPSNMDVNKIMPLCRYSFPNYPDGSLITSVRELSYFLRAIINDGTYNNAKILEKSTIDKMLTIQISGGKSQGLCWSKLPFESFWGHSGGDYGIATYMFLNRKNKIGIITFQNSTSASPWKFFEELYWIVENNK